jgi:DNA-binding PadR family transcriptional regulator
VETEMAGNRMRKYYSITHEGQKEVVNRMAELEVFIRQMQNLLKPRIELA